jgi:very-short-patch-repair endonuclease
MSYASHLRTNQTDAEKRLWQALRNRQLAGFKFRRQFPLPPYIADFVCLECRLIVEVDGGQHVEQQEYDDERTRVLLSQGFRVLRRH